MSRIRRSWRVYRECQEWRVSSLRIINYPLSMTDDLSEPLRFLETMVMMESPSFDKGLVDTLGRFVAVEFAKLGGRVEIVPAQRFGDQVIIRFGQDKSLVLLFGHIDMVFPKGESEKRLFQI